MGRPDITDLGLSMGKMGRLRRILHQSGLRNGTALLLPYGVDLSRAPQRSAASDHTAQAHSRDVLQLRLRP